MIVRRSAILAAADPRGRVLQVLQRGGAYAGHWLLPGGRLETGEDARAALEREVREETGCTVRDARELALYEVRVGDEEWQVLLFRGTVRGTLRAEAGSDVGWRDPRAHGLHPSLRLELTDAGLRSEDRLSLARDLDRAGIRMRRLR